MGRTTRRAHREARGHDEEVKQFTRNNLGQLAFTQLPNSADLLLMISTWITLLFYTTLACSFTLLLPQMTQRKWLW